MPDDDFFPVFPAAFGRYRVIRRIGKGGMGAVYLADDTNFRSRKVAIKIPSQELTDETALRFEREANATAILDHPNICPVYDVGTLDGRRYLAMKFVDGRPLSDLVGHGKLWPEETAIIVVRKLAEALQYAHEKGVIHRDIKPQNIVLTATDEPVLMDFGLAKMSGDPTLTQAGSVFGTPHYMPIEQARGHIRKIGPWSDVYSLGVVLFEMLSGQRPFVGDTPMDVFARLALDKLPRLRQIRPDADPQLEAVCQKAMAKNRKDRYATMREFATALIRCQQSKPVSVYLPSHENFPLNVPPELIIPKSPHIPTLFTEDTHSPIKTYKELNPERSRFYWVIGLFVVLSFGGCWYAVLRYREIPMATRGSRLDQVEETKIEAKKSTIKQANIVPFDVPQPEQFPEEKRLNLRNKDPKDNPIIHPETIPIGEGTPAIDQGEKIVEFEYVIDDVKKKGKCRVLILDIGGGAKMEFVRIPKGKFTMGTPLTETDRVINGTNEDQRDVVFDSDFYMARYETTQAQYKAVTNESPSWFQGDRLPVERVTWVKAKTDFCSPLSKKLGRLVTLPTEEQWEYSCRAGTTSPFHFGSKLNGNWANCSGSWPYGMSQKGLDRRETVNVGTYPANPWGLYDMHGNVEEWCETKYSDSIDRRIVRGGSYQNIAQGCRAGFRTWEIPDFDSQLRGFRVCLPIVPNR